MANKSSVSKPAAIPGRPHGVRPAITALPMSKIGEVSAPDFGDPDIVPLWFGEGDLPTPAFICEAAAAAMRRGETFYTFKRGIPELREAIATYLTGLHAKPVAAENVVVTSSGMSAIMMTMEAIIDPGDSVVVLHPVWPNINATIGIMGGIAKPVSLASTQEGGWKLDLQRVIDACDQTTRAIYVNSPGNPTGWMMTREDAEALLEFARKRGLWLLSDEVYSRIVYGRRVAPSFHDVAEPEDRVVALQSFSKAWAMTGWRLGWMVAPPEMLTVMDKIVEYNTSGSPTFLQHAAVTAIKDGEPLIHEIVERCHIGRDLFVQGLARFPRVTVKSPEGSFYAFARVDGCTDSFKLARKIITQAKVGVAPGIAFGDAGEGYLRFCFASSKERLGEALDRMAKTKVLS